MSEVFDPYYKWLGIPREEQPPNHYRLLGIVVFESDHDVIANAADRQMVHVRGFQTGAHGELSQKLLNEIAQAKVCLLNPAKKAAYDQKLRAELKAKKSSATQPATQPNAGAATAPRGTPPASLPRPVRPVAAPLAARPRAMPAAAPVAAVKVGTEDQAVVERLRRGRGAPWLIVAGVAAVLLVVAFGWLLFFRHEEPAPIAAGAAPASGDDSSPATPPTSAPTPTSTSMPDSPATRPTSTPPATETSPPSTTEPGSQGGRPTVSIGPSVSPSPPPSRSSNPPSNSPPNQPSTSQPPPGNQPPPSTAAPSEAPFPLKQAPELTRPKLEPVNLLEAPTRSLKGQWSLRRDRLVTPTEVHSKLLFHELDLPPAFDVVMEVTRRGERDFLALGFPVGGRPVVAQLDGYSFQSGVDMVDGTMTPGNASVYRGQVLPTDQTAMVEWKVRSRSVQVRVDGKSIMHVVDRPEAWMVAAPLEVRSEVGRKFELLPDGSYLAAADPRPDVYTLVFHTEHNLVALMALEMLPEPRLPGEGPGLASDPPGAIEIQEIECYMAPVTGGPVQHIPLTALADRLQQPRIAPQVCDGDPATAFSSTTAGERRLLLLRPVSRFKSPGGVTVALRIVQNRPQRLLGRFRLLHHEDSSAREELPRSRFEGPMPAFWQVPEPYRLFLASGAEFQITRMELIPRLGPGGATPAASRTVPQTPATTPPPTTPPTGTQPPLERASALRPVPGEEELEAARRQVREVFREVYDPSSKPEDKRAAIERLCNEGAVLYSDPVERYAMLDEARQMACNAGDWELAARASDELARVHDVSRPALLVQAFHEVCLKSHSIAEWAALAEAAEAVVTAAADVDDFDGAQRALAAGLNAANRSKQLQRIKHYNDRKREITELQRRQHAALDALKRIEAGQADPQAHRTLGEYLCLLRHRWAEGLPHLAQSGDDVLTNLAQREQATPALPDDQTALGDAWYDAAQRMPRDRQALYRQRAEYWYLVARTGLTGLARTRVEKRLAELLEQGPPRWRLRGPFSWVPTGAWLDPPGCPNEFRGVFENGQGHVQGVRQLATVRVYDRDVSQLGAAFLWEVPHRALLDARFDVSGTGMKWLFVATDEQVAVMEVDQNFSGSLSVDGTSGRLRLTAGGQNANVFLRLKSGSFESRQPLSLVSPDLLVSQFRLPEDRPIRVGFGAGHQWPRSKADVRFRLTVLPPQ